MVRDGIGHVGEERRVAVAVNVGCRLLEALVLGVAVLLVREVPDVDVVRRGAADLDRPRLAEKIERLLEVLGIYVDRALDRGDRPVGEG